MKKRVISIVLGLCILTLAGCGSKASQPGAASQPVLVDTKVEVQDVDLSEQGAQLPEQDAKEILPDDTGAAEEMQTEDPVSESEIEERIEDAGKAYDGIVSYDRPSIDAILLESDIMSVTERDFARGTREEKAAVETYMELVQKFRSYFTEQKVYEPKEGYTIAISAKKLYTYKIADTDAILSIYEKMQRAQRDVPVMTDRDKSVRSGVLGGIAGLFSGSSASVQYESAAVAESCDDMVCAEEAAPASNAAAAAAPDASALAGAVPDAEATAEILPAPAQVPDWNTEEYKAFDENRFMSVQASPFSTFGMDVDTASFSNFRKKIFNGRDIPTDSIRTEEMINYFNYAYAKPEKGEKFGVTTEISDTPWNPDTKLLRVGVKSEEADTKEVASNIVFLIDTSGSMFDPDKLPLVQKSFLMLLHKLDKNDKVSIVTYAGGDEIRCEGVPCSKKEKVTEEILSLEAWGGTNGAAGITTAYELAKRNFIEGGNNRVILATDGDLNLGLTSESDLVDLIQEEKESGVFLSVLGVGAGNYKDSKMKALADNGNGNFSYIDSTAAADKALMQDFNSLMYTVAKDAKMQIEFNPAKIKGYRQIGYELRQLNAEDFADDTKDGAEIGSGQCVTVLYEIVPADSDMEIPGVSSKYGNSAAGDSATDELLTVSIRYKEPDAEKSRLLEVPVTGQAYKKEMSRDLSWAAGVAEVSQILRESEYKGSSTYEAVYNRLKKDSRIMQDENRAQFMYMIQLLEKGNIGVSEEDELYYW